MSELIDVVVPMVQGIQSRLTNIERLLAEQGASLTENGSKPEDLDIHLAYLTGTESQNRFDLKGLRQRVRAVEERLSVLQPQP